MNPDQHPALATGRDSPQALTLILPSRLGKDQVLARLVEAIEQVRGDIAARAELFHQRTEQAAACGDTLNRALYHGQVIAGDHAATAIDEEIIGLFDLWDQYPCHLDASQSAPPAHPPAASPASAGRPNSKQPLGLGPLEAAIMAVAWAVSPRWLPPRAIHQLLDYPRPVAHTSVATVTANLHRKGLLERRERPRRGGWEYQAVRTLDEHIGELIAGLLDASASPPAALAHALRRPVCPAAERP